MIKLLPIRYKILKDKIIITNEVGQFFFLTKDNFNLLINNPIQLSPDLKNNLISKNFICEDYYFDQTIDELAIKLRTKKNFLTYFTTLHIIVLTQNCNSNCSYCHASSHSTSINQNLNMSIQTARKVCEIIMQSPSPAIKIEFQGGEPSLNFKTLSFIIEYIKILNKKAKKIIEYVICTNLLEIDKKQLKYLIKNNVYISTSVDGPKDIHNEYRKSITDITNFDRVTKNIAEIKKIYGIDKVSALMTITKKALYRLNECIDIYVELGLNSIFLRPINPYGMAEKTKEFLNYSIEDYLKAYKEALKYILELNLKGIYIKEEFACVFLRKILTPFSNGFVDIQSPTGNGIGCAVYDITGEVFVSDEARMLAKNGDKSFCIGNVLNNDYYEIFNNEKLRNIVKENIIEANINCFGCPYIPYCGKDAVRNYQEENLNIQNSNCKKHKGIIDILFTFINENSKYETVFWSWITDQKYEEISL
ncbi:MAG: His-Xaa-Ser system radical SAM maturase HxsB [Pleomorphochaeta sp.]